MLISLAGIWLAAAPDPAAAARLDAEIRTAAGFRQVRAAEYRLAPQPEFPIRRGRPAEAIGQYRVRAAAGQQEYAKRILDAALSECDPARAHALEAAAKLRLQVPEEARRRLRQLVETRPDSLEAAYAVWLLAVNQDAAMQKRLTGDLAAAQETRRLTAAIAAGYLPELPPDYESGLRRLARQPETPAGSFAQWSLARHGRQDATPVRRGLAAPPAELPEKVLRYWILALGESGNATDLPLLRKYLAASAPETANAAAGAILRINQRD